MGGRRETLGLFDGSGPCGQPQARLAAAERELGGQVAIETACLHMHHPVRRCRGIEVDVDKIIDDNRYDLDIPMRPFDIVMVPKSRLASTEDFVETFSAFLLKPMDIYLKGWNVANVKTLYDFYKSTGQAR